MIDVLVVDDDFMVAKINSGFVRKVEGFQVIGVAHSGEQALAAVGDLRPDLVLLDLYLPDLFGLEVINRMRATGHDCDVIVISAAREIETVRRAARRGVVGYLLKPFEFDDLRVRLERYAAQRAGPGDGVIHSQADVDRLLAGGGPSAAPALPKGMSVETVKLVKRALATTDGTLSATECATRVGISRVSARRYLEHLTAIGQVVVSLRYGSTGRPERRYRWHPPK
ncbi:response regulator [Rhizohabitans arisaemae]|uniref:response regulator n=1 Tax=Rhizohabitans arisaemae TaxID=2720610 RepID=UPI0024B14A68|nr:response regulator [Rhizohabitans arisaemae]